MSIKYSEIIITNNQAAGIAFELYGIQGRAVSLPGEVDFNFRIDSEDGKYLLKVSRPDADLEYLVFQQVAIHSE